MLLVDDHHQVLSSVSAMLSDAFDVVGTATSGLEALDTARRLNPDVIVLDVEMPGMNGFQTCHRLKRSGLTAPVVFLSNHDADEIVSAGFECGGRGYVVKRRAGSDLAGAIDGALDGRSFVPSLISLLPLAGDGLHATQLYQDEEAFVVGLAELFHFALRSGDATCIIASPRIREGLADRLRAKGWHVDGPAGHKRYLALDAGEALKRFMRDGIPDPDRLAEIARSLDEYRRAVCEGATSRLTVCGNIAVELIAGGNTHAALALERHWSALTHGRPFLTVCAYASSCFHDDMPDLWPGICTEHRALSHTTDV